MPWYLVVQCNTIELSFNSTRVFGLELVGFDRKLSMFMVFRMHAWNQCGGLTKKHSVWNKLTLMAFNVPIFQTSTPTPTLYQKLTELKPYIFLIPCTLFWQATQKSRPWKPYQGPLPKWCVQKTPSGGRIHWTMSLPYSSISSNKKTSFDVWDTITVIGFLEPTESDSFLLFWSPLFRNCVAFVELDKPPDSLLTFFFSQVCQMYRFFCMWTWTEDYVGNTAYLNTWTARPRSN